MRWAGRCRRDSSALRRETTLSSTIRSLDARTMDAALVGGRDSGGIYSEDEIWSCTTCGACEAECPLLVEYIDKIVDLRRGMVDDGKVPQSLHKPLKSLESRGNPYGKMEKKRADWAQGAESGFWTSRRRRRDSCISSTASLPTTTGCSRSGAPRPNPGRSWRELRHPRREGERQRARSPAVRRRDTVPGPARPQRGGHPRLGRATDRDRRPARLQRAEA